MADRPVLAVASTGGHLAELYALLPRMGFDRRRVEWVTFDSDHSRSLLAGERVHMVRTTRTRDVASLAANVGVAAGILHRRQPEAVISTGAGIALAFLPLARARGIPAHYVELITRLDGPSVTGRLLARLPRVRTYTQVPAWADGRWRYRGSVLDAFTTEAAPPPGPLRRVVVTLGQNPYGFRRLLERMIEILPAGAEVLWQTGTTDTAGLPIDARASLPSRELSQAMRDADVVVAHAGTGSALAALGAGKVPVLVARRPEHDEQIDDHQVAFAAWLHTDGLAVSSDVDDLTLEVLERVRRRRATQRTDVPPFDLTG